MELVGAGRTDAGVHAKQMYAHFETNALDSIPELIQKLNSYLPKDIAIHAIYRVPEEAHARFDAIKRTYEYHIHQQKDAFDCSNSWHYHYPLDLKIMNEACQILFEYHDFECFSKTHTDVNTFNCKIYEAHWREQHNRFVFTISADRFLRNMVRAIVGTMIDVGRKKITLEQFRTIIENKDRNQAGFSVPAHGLYLTQVIYPYL